MFYYCENCNTLNEQDYCKFCGKEFLRKPERNDYCLLIETGFMFAEMFKGVLDEENIPYTDCPSGNGVRSQFALRLENVKIFVPYEFYFIAKELLNEILKNIEESQNRDFFENIDLLFIQLRNEKKIKKTLKMPETYNLVAYCLDKIKNADRIDNKGKISGCTKGGDYIFVYKGAELIIVNSATYEIISVERNKKGEWA